MSQGDQSPNAGVNRVNCVGIAVRDLGRSLRFYETLTGVVATPQRRIASRRLTGDGGLAQATTRLATIHLSNLNIDLLEHEAPSGDLGRPGQNRAGTMHLCFEVDDLDAVFDRMAAAGLEWNGGQERYEADHRSDEGLLTSIAYFEDPDGTLLGLIHPVGTFRRFRESFVV